MPGNNNADIFRDPSTTAKLAGLRYVGDAEPGYQRKRWGKGFTYLDPEGNHVKAAEERARFDELAIPPAWTDVWICLDSMGHIQATGRDGAGRKQYVYHPRWWDVRNVSKFGRLISFGQCLPHIRTQVDQDLNSRGLSRQKVLAIVVRLLEVTRIRIGNSEYARRHGSRGLTTLADEHVSINGSRLYFDFVGKSGKRRQLDIRDRRLAYHLKKCQDLPGQDLFQYIDDEGACRTISSGDVNAYIREISGADFTAKDFRTWAGSVLALDELCLRGPGDTEAETERNIVAAVKATAEALGNTPHVCRTFYIHPAIIQSYRDGELFSAVSQAASEVVDDPNDLSTDEHAVLAILNHYVDR